MCVKWNHVLHTVERYPHKRYKQLILWGNQTVHFFKIMAKPTSMENELMNKSTDMKTLVSCLNSLVRNGFEEHFKVTESGLKALRTGKYYTPVEVKISNFYRFEGDSDPGDNSILYAIETKDGLRGTLVDAYGPYADSKVTNFMTEVENINKKTDRDVKL